MKAARHNLQLMTRPAQHSEQPPGSSPSVLDMTLTSTLSHDQHTQQSAHDPVPDPMPDPYPNPNPALTLHSAAQGLHLTAGTQPTPDPLQPTALLALCHCRCIAHPA